MGHGHQLHPDNARLRLSRRRGGLVQPPHFELEAVDHHGRILLPGGSGEALSRKEKPEIFNTARAASSPAKAFTQQLKTHEIQVSMDSRGHALGNSELSVEEKRGQTTGPIGSSPAI